MEVETENYEIAAKGFENTDFVVCILVVQLSREILPVGYLKGWYGDLYSNPGPATETSARRPLLEAAEGAVQALVKKKLCSNYVTRTHTHTRL